MRAEELADFIAKMCSNFSSSPQMLLLLPHSLPVLQCIELCARLPTLFLLPRMGSVITAAIHHISIREEREFYLFTRLSTVWPGQKDRK